MPTQLDVLNALAAKVARAKARDPAKAARDAALDLVASNAMSTGWWDAAWLQVEALRDWTGTGEDLRLHIRRFVGDPHTHQVWGALVAKARKRNKLHRTGQRRPMRTVKSHARMTDVYSTNKPNGKT